MRGCVHIYCGEGKGKTTAAVGQAVRAAGRGMRVLIARFLKTDDSGEVNVLRQIPGITLIACDKSFGFYFQMSEEQKKEARGYYSGLFEKCRRLAEEESFDMAVLDEIMAAVNYRLVDLEAVTDFLEKRPEKLEVVMTGRDPDEALIRSADYISRIQMVRHPYQDRGLEARKGIEY